MPLADLVKLVRKNIKKEQINALPNGLICLKGGELAHEILPFRNQAISMDLKDHFKEEFFETKKVVYVPYDYDKIFRSKLFLREYLLAIR